MEWDLIKKIDQSEHSFFKVWKWIFMHVVRHPYKQHFVFFPFFNLGKFVSSLNWKVCTSNPNDALDQTFGPNLFTMPMLNFIWNNLDEWSYVLLVVQIWPWVGQITDEKWVVWSDMYGHVQSDVKMVDLRIISYKEWFELRSWFFNMWWTSLKVTNSFSYFKWLWSGTSAHAQSYSTWWVSYVSKMNWEA